MRHEDRELDIPNRQMLTANLEPRVSISRDIGEATVTHTIFGKAKVRIVRKYDNLRRAIWLLVTAALAAAAWQAWLAFRPVEPLQSADPLSSANAPEQESQPVHLPEIAAPSAESKPVTAPAVAVAKPVINQQTVPHPAPGFKAAAPIPAKPVATRPLPIIKPQSAPLAASSRPVSIQPPKPLPPKPMPATQPAAPAAVPPRATLPAAQPAASSPAALIPMASPLSRETAPTQAPAVTVTPPAN